MLQRFIEQNLICIEYQNPHCKCKQSSLVEKKISFGLPDPDNEKTIEKRADVASANDEVGRVRAISKKREE